MGNAEIGARALGEVFEESLVNNPDLGETLRADIIAHYDRDPACRSYLDPVLYYKGFLALQAHRAAHWMINHDRRATALYIQNRASEVFQADIHPAAKIGRVYLSTMQRVLLLVRRQSLATMYLCCTV